MAEQQQQNYANHVRRVPRFIALAFVLMATLIGSIVNLYQSWSDHQRLYSAALILVLTLCVVAAAFSGRIFALKAQDRAIRAEENLRHYVLTGKLLDSRLSVGQIAAVRFASDSEFADLAKQAAEKGMGAKEIKKAVKNWRADWHRV